MVGFFPKFAGIVLYLRRNEKRKIIIKSTMMIFRHLAFGLYYRQTPSWYIKVNLTNVKKTDANEYCLKYCIMNEIAKNKITRKKGCML